MIGLTGKQKRLLDFLRARLQHDGVSPSYDEIKSFLAVGSKNTVHRLVVQLESRGYLRRIPGHYRAIELIDQASDPIDVARDALARVGAPATSSNLDKVAGALAEAKRSAA